MNDYLITPRYVLGSDSFRISAEDFKDATAKALEYIHGHDYHSPYGWLVYQEVGEIDDHDETGHWVGKQT